MHRKLLNLCSAESHQASLRRRLIGTRIDQLYRQPTGAPGHLILAGWQGWLLFLRENARK